MMPVPQAARRRRQARYRAAQSAKAAAMADHPEARLILRACLETRAVRDAAVHRALSAREARLFRTPPVEALRHALAVDIAPDGRFVVTVSSAAVLVDGALDTRASAKAAAAYARAACSVEDRA